jgi:Mandelate racemase / muconate lactonizing enzyme, N-terminal domain
MKIVDVRTIPLSYKCEPPYGSAGGMQSARGGLIVEIDTDNGITGIGEAGVGGGSTRHVIETQLRPMLVGEDPLLIEALWQKMFARTRQFGRRGIVLNALSGIDIALWDIAGKVAKLPLYRLFGACRDRVEAYASGGFYQPGKSIDDLAAEAEGYRSRGFKHEDEGRPQSVDPDISAPSRRQRAALRGRARGGHRPGRGGAPRARAKGQVDGRCQLRLEPGNGDRDGPGARTP